MTKRVIMRLGITSFCQLISNFTKLGEKKKRGKIEASVLFDEWGQLQVV